MFKQLVILLLFPLYTWAIVGVPKITHQITDITSTLSAIQTEALENKLAAFESKKGRQITVLIVPTTQPKDIAEFSMEVSDLAQIGSKQIDDRVILLVVKNDQKLHLDVSDSLKNVISDTVAERLMTESVSPYFKSGDFAGGIDAGVSQLMGLLDSENLPAVSPENSWFSQNKGAIMYILLVGLVVGFVLSVLMGHLLGGVLAGLASGMLAVVFFGLTLWLGTLFGFTIFAVVAGARYAGWRSWFK